MQRSDQALVAEVLAGGRNAFVELVEGHQDLVAHLVFRLIGDRRDAEEVCQDVFVKVYGQLGSFRFQSRLSTWIARIAYNTSLNRLAKREVHWVATDFSDYSGEEGPDERVSDRQLKRLVHSRLGELSVLEKSVLTFYHLEGMSIPEMSQIMARPAGTIKSDLYRARKKLKELIVREELV
ncbi:MAG TPA: RNA polymerase sigma factor [Pseudomonadales bacterium]|nr:RNA polymerase sigma factor [Pseudomonadales bacterium]